MAAAAVTLDDATHQRAMEVGNKQNCLFMGSERVGMPCEWVVHHSSGSLPSLQSLLLRNVLTRPTRGCSFDSRPSVRWRINMNHHSIVLFLFP